MRSKQPFIWAFKRMEIPEKIGSGRNLNNIPRKTKGVRVKKVKGHEFRSFLGPLYKTGMETWLTGIS